VYAQLVERFELGRQSSESAFDKGMSIHRGSI
jgi:hypothetical protein